MHPHAAGVRDRHDERGTAVQDVALEPVCHTAQGCVGQGLQPVEDRFALNRPVDDFGSGTPFRLAPLWRLGVRRLGPDDRRAVTAGDHEQPAAGGRRRVIRSAQDLVFDLVPHAAQQAGEAPPGFAGARGIGNEVLLLDRHALALPGHTAVQLDHSTGALAAFRDQRSPLPDLLDVLQSDDARANLPRPPDADPRQRTELAAARLAALRLAVVDAIGAHVQQADRSAARDEARRDFFAEHVGAEVLGLRVVHSVHAAGVVVVIDADVDVTTDRLLDRLGHAATAGELIDEQLVLQRQDELTAPLRCVGRALRRRVAVVHGDSFPEWHGLSTAWLRRPVPTSSRSRRAPAAQRPWRPSMKATRHVSEACWRVTTRRPARA